MASWEKYIQPLQFDTIIPQPEPSFADKLVGYIKQGQEMKSRRLKMNAEQREAKDQAELRQAQKELADDFRMNPPKDAADMLGRMQAFFMQKGKPELALNAARQLEDAKAKQVQQVEANKLKSEQLQQRQAESRNKMLSNLLNSKNLGILEAMPDATLSAFGLTKEQAKDISTAWKASQEGKDPASMNALMAKYWNRGDMTGAQAVGDAINMMYAQRAQASAAAHAPYQQLPTYVDKNDKVWSVLPGGQGAIPLKTVAGPEMVVPGGYEIPAAPADSINIPAPNLATPGAPLAAPSTGTEGVPFVDAGAAAKAAGVGEQLMARPRAQSTATPLSEKPLPQKAQDLLIAGEKQLGMIDEILNIPEVKEGKLTGPQDLFDQFLAMKQGVKNAYPEIRMLLGILRAEYSTTYFGKALTNNEKAILDNIANNLDANAFKSTTEFVSQMKKLKEIVQKANRTVAEMVNMTRGQAREKYAPTLPTQRPTEGMKFK